MRSIEELQQLKTGLDALVQARKKLDRCNVAYRDLVDVRANTPARASTYHARSSELANECQQRERWLKEYFIRVFALFEHKQGNEKST